jgi:exosome complex RNA-binding protein Rrp4
MSTEQTCKDDSKLCKNCFAYAFNTILGHRWAWRPILSCVSQTFASTHYRSVNGCCLVQVHLIKIRSSIGEQYKLRQPQNAIHILLNGLIFCSTEAEQDATELLHTRMRTESDLTNQGKHH